MAPVRTPYAQAEGYIIVDANAREGGLNAEVWRHERLAREQGLHLVLEIYSVSVLASRRLTEWWCSGGKLAEDTLTGIYLLRVDLKRYGPQAVLRLTPYAVAGAPLFVGWNPVGQVLSRNQFEELRPASMALPLSAFVEDVLASRPHTLNPRPSIGNVERNREAQALRQAAVHLLDSPQATASDKRAGVATQLTQTASLASASPSDRNGGDSSDGSDSSDRSSSSATPRPESPPDVLREQTLEPLLEAARGRFAELEELLGQTLSFTLDDLRILDLAIDALNDEQRLVFAREFGAVLAVYLGDTIRIRVPADWQLEESGQSVSERLLLRGEVLGEAKQTQPMQWVIETLADPTRSLYGQALAWCRIH